jgi:hypothetical protein
MLIDDNDIDDDGLWVALIVIGALAALSASLICDCDGIATPPAPAADRSPEVEVASLVFQQLAHSISLCL